MSDRQTEKSAESKASEDCALQEVGRGTYDDDNIPLAKLASNGWSDFDNGVPEVYDFVIHKMWFPWIRRPKKSTFNREWVM